MNNIPSTDDTTRRQQNHHHHHHSQHYMRAHSDVQCANCGGRGHMYRMCDRPVISFGVVCFRTNRKTGAVDYMMVQRKDSLAYVEFIRGKYSLMNTDYIVQMLSNMTRAEQDRLVSCDGFESLWSDFWQSDTTRNFVKEYEQSSTRFATLKEGYLSGDSEFSLRKALAESRRLRRPYEETEFGFPKGRRNINESDVSCACREFSEETGIPEEAIRLVPGVEPFEETFWGSNNVRYRHTYFLARYVGKQEEQEQEQGDDVHDAMPSNQAVETTPSNPMQMREIRAFGWFTAEGVLSRLRMHYTERRALFQHIHRLVTAPPPRYHHAAASLQWSRAEAGAEQRPESI